MSCISYIISHAALIKKMILYLGTFTVPVGVSCPYAAPLWGAEVRTLNGTHKVSHTQDHSDHLYFSLSHTVNIF